MTDKFYLPFHFVPPAKGERKGDLPVTEYRNGSAGDIRGVRHDLYLPDTYSGTIQCEAKALSPVFVGDQRPEGQNEVPAFKLDGQPALPASSLRGLFSAIAEAASNSAPRVLGRTVLGEPCYSYRKPMQSPLSAIGKLCEDGGQLSLEPVCLPLMQYDPRGNLQPDLKKWKTVFAAAPIFRVYIGDQESIRSKGWAVRTTSTASEKKPLHQLAWRDVESLTPLANNALNIKPGRTIVSQKIDSTAPTQDGLTRVLGCYEKDPLGEELRQIPGNKKHELFLPYIQGRFPKLPIPAHVIERFQQLANQMTKQSEKETSPRPYEPKGTRPGRAAKQPLVPQAGDLVFFEVSPDAKTVSEISYSSIWRGRVETIINGVSKGANAWSFFRAVDNELVPFNPERRQITVAEQLFGFSEEKDGEEIKDGLRFRGRVRFSHGIAKGEINEVELTPLKELSSPKPPSPALYFRNPTGENSYIAKSKLTPRTHWPHGRKFYLHHPNTILENASPWKNAGKFEESRHVKVKPWAKESVWRFEVRFDNLSSAELGLLLYALKPTAEFRHKIGMGKPLGLGSIEVTIGSVQLVNRQKRYTSAGWSEPRSSKQDPLGFSWEQCRDKYRESMITSIRSALEELGNPAKLDKRTPIAYPQLLGQDYDMELYQWFVSNDDPKNGQTAALQPIVIGENVLPKIQPLPRLPAPRNR